jgi:predicted alpha/beta-hydrolase family hydrolase
MSGEELLFDGPGDAGWTLALAHGAGQPMRSPFMDGISRGLAAGGIRVVRFEFPYMAEMQRSGKRRPPDREPVLLETWSAVIDRLLDPETPREGLLIGGKSMGGRVASLLADERPVAGLVCLGYPFHPPGRPEKTRVEHLRGLRTPTLICQGTRDPFGRPEEVKGYELSDAVHLAWIEDGEHSFKPRKASGRSLEDNLADAVQAVLGFVYSLG